VRLLTQYRTLPKRRKTSSHFQWFLVGILALFVGWVWWRNLQDFTPKSAPGESGKLRLTPALRAGATGGAPSINIEGSIPSADHQPPRNAFEIQIALARRRVSPGSLDGVMGGQTRAALRAFQMSEGLPVTGEADAATKERLFLTRPAERQYTIMPEDMAGLSPLGRTWLAKSQQNRLHYETILEAISEKAHGYPALIRKLNPSIDWNMAGVGTSVRIPDVDYGTPTAKAAVIRIHLGAKMLDVFDSGNKLLAHFPCSIARQVSKRPVGKLVVETIVEDPNYTFSAEIFPESEEARQLKRPLIIPPGPNNPVGTAWIGLNRRGYGIHGTPRPEDVGRTESHGCFRLANWNADYLVQLVEIGTPVFVEP
jgi:lipoprotein-anchoring transpeptidase ErfK/SrfK